MTTWPEPSERAYIPWSSSFYLSISLPDNLIHSSHRSLKKSAALWMDAYYKTWCRCQPWCARNLSRRLANVRELPTYLSVPLAYRSVLGVWTPRIHDNFLWTFPLQISRGNTKWLWPECQMGNGVQCYYFFQKIFNLVLPTGLIQIISVAGRKYKNVKTSLTTWT